MEDCKELQTLKNPEAITEDGERKLPNWMLSNQLPSVEDDGSLLPTDASLNDVYTANSNICLYSKYFCLIQNFYSFHSPRTRKMKYHQTNGTLANMEPAVIEGILTTKKNSVIQVIKIISHLFQVKVPKMLQQMINLNVHLELHVTDRMYNIKGISNTRNLINLTVH